jgi:hypothetical protein
MVERARPLPCRLQLLTVLTEDKARLAQEPHELADRRHGQARTSDGAGVDRDGARVARGENQDEGGLAFGPDGLLYWSVGDNGNFTGVGDDLASPATKIGRVVAAADADPRPRASVWRSPRTGAEDRWLTVRRPPTRDICPMARRRERGDHAGIGQADASRRSPMLSKLVPVPALIVALTATTLAGNRVDTITGRYFGGDGRPGTASAISFGELQDIDGSGAVYFFDSHLSGLRVFRPGDGETHVDEIVADWWSDAVPEAFVVIDDQHELWAMPNWDSGVTDLQLLEVHADGSRVLRASYPTDGIVIQLAYDPTFNRVYFIDGWMNRRLGMLDLDAEHPVANTLTDDECVCAAPGETTCRPIVAVGLAVDGAGGLLVTDVAFERIEGEEEEEGERLRPDSCMLRYDPEPLAGGRFTKVLDFYEQGHILGKIAVTSTGRLVGLAAKLDADGKFPDPFTPRTDFVAEVSADGTVTDLGYALDYPSGVAFDDQGRLHVTAEFQVLKRDASDEGWIVVAGQPHPREFPGQPRPREVPGGQAQLLLPIDIAADAAGNLYIAELWLQQVRMVDGAGRYRDIAGTTAWPGDGKPIFGHPRDFHGGWISSIALAPGGLYYGHAETGVISYHKFGPNGVADGIGADADPNETVELLVGTPYSWWKEEEDPTDLAVPDGTAAHQARLAHYGFIKSMAQLDDGGVAFGEADHHMIYVVKDNVVYQLAGKVGADGRGVAQCGAEHVPSRGTPIAAPHWLTSDGETIYFPEPRCGRIRAVQDGLIYTIAGPPGLGVPDRNARGPAVDGIGPAARFTWVSSVSVAPDGSLLATDEEDASVRKVTCSRAEPHRHDPSCQWKVTTIAGNRVRFGAIDGPGGDPYDDFHPRPTAALESTIGKPVRVHVSPSGAVHVTDLDVMLVRRLFTDDATHLDVLVGASGVSTTATLNEARRVAFGSATLEALDVHGVPRGVPVRATETGTASSPSEAVTLSFDMPAAEATGAAAFRQRFCFSDGACTVIVGDAGAAARAVTPDLRRTNARRR